MFLQTVLRVHDLYQNELWTPKHWMEVIQWWTREDDRQWLLGKGIDEDNWVTEGIFMYNRLRRVENDEGWGKQDKCDTVTSHIVTHQMSVPLPAESFYTKFLGPSKPKMPPQSNTLPIPQTPVSFKKSGSAPYESGMHLRPSLNLKCDLSDLSDLSKLSGEDEPMPFDPLPGVSKLPIKQYATIPPTIHTPRGHCGGRSKFYQSKQASVWRSGPVRSFGPKASRPGPGPVHSNSFETRLQTEPVWTGPVWASWTSLDQF